jgi:hypothetical protein
MPEVSRNAQGRTRNALRSFGPEARPAVAARRRRCQAYLLEAAIRRGSVKAAIADLVALRDRDINEYCRIVGSTRPLAPRTLLRYWSQIPLTWRSRQVAEEAAAPRAASSRARGVCSSGSLRDDRVHVEAEE